MPAVTGYTRRQTALHWIVAALILMHYLFKGGIASAWEGWRSGAAVASGPVVAAHIALGALFHQFVLRDGLLARMRLASI